MDKPKRFRRAFAHAYCESCGKPIFRINRTAVKFCSNACRQAAYRARYGNPQADLARVTVSACKPLKSKAENSRFSKSNLPIDLLGGHSRGELDPELRRTILAIETTFNRRDWLSVVSPDGVRCLILGGAR